jgi:PAS domain-containing protein
MQPSRLSHTVFDMKRLRSAAAEVRRQQLPPRASEVFEQLFDTCEALERDLAGAEMDLAARQAAAEQQAAKRDYLFEMMPVACIETDSGGTILRTNRAAATLLNTSPKHLVGRLLLHFMEDRESFRLFMQDRDRQDGQAPLACCIRPRERAPIAVDCQTIAASAAGGFTSLLFLLPAQQPAVLRKAGRSAAVGGDARAHPGM